MLVSSPLILAEGPCTNLCFSMLLIETPQASWVPELIPQGTAAFSFDQSYDFFSYLFKKYLKNYNWLHIILSNISQTYLFLWES